LKTSPIVIDGQESFRRRPYFSAGQRSSYLTAQHKLTQDAQRLNLPIVRIFHREGPERASKPWYEASGCLIPLNKVGDITAV
jgi:hypothetical protein